MAGGDYGRIRHTFWTDPDIKRVLTPEQKALLLYYFTSPHRTLVGLYYCPLEYAASETGLPLEQVRGWTLGALSKFVTYDESTEEILVHGAGKHQVGEHLAEKDNQRKAIEKALVEAHSAKLVRRFLSLYAHWSLAVSAPPEPPRGEKEAPSEPLASPSEAKAVAVSGTEQIPPSVANATGGEPPKEEDSSEPDPEAVWNAARPLIAGAIRTHGWLGAGPPPIRTQSRQPWRMDNELSIARELLKQFTPEELVGGIECWREVHATPEGQQFSLAQTYKQGERHRIGIAVAHWRIKQEDAAPVLDLTSRLSGGRDAA